MLSFPHFPFFEPLVTLCSLEDLAVVPLWVFPLQLDITVHDKGAWPCVAKLSSLICFMKLVVLTCRRVETMLLSTP